MENNREIKFSYILQHEETGIIHEQIFDYLAIYLGACRDQILRMNRHMVVAKRQFTGLLDKNGKEIYEGDLIKHPNATEPEDCGWIVKFESFKWICVLSKPFIDPETNKQLQTDFSDYFSKCEIIGNIYEPHQ